ncbi:proline-, glutamic acid- and leucine-rich protein 1-like [Schistocerca americana]|uniref:proline-, glutamic acid- and leucine-rich protein 1-like n=1 Tax=Schistocerca americana TaxID=7009 RepID=UPI001F4FED4C|nr:proline-, glutamic acid- and leucine-rich protein 1-like [Schistocerca americana]
MGRSPHGLLSTPRQAGSGLTGVFLVPRYRAGSGCVSVAQTESVLDRQLNRAAPALDTPPPPPPRAPRASAQPAAGPGRQPPPAAQCGRDAGSSDADAAHRPASAPPPHGDAAAALRSPRDALPPPPRAPAQLERRNLTSDDIHRILAELDREEAEGKGHEESLEDDVSDDPDYELEGIEGDTHQSESEIDLENGGENDIDQQELPTNDIKFYIGKDMDTIWASSANITSTKSKSKNIIKILPGPRGQDRQRETRLESFQCIVTPEMVEGILRYTNIYIERKKLARQALAEGSRNSKYAKGIVSRQQRLKC